MWPQDYATGRTVEARVLALAYFRVVKGVEIHGSRTLQPRAGRAVV